MEETELLVKKAEMLRREMTATPTPVEMEELMVKSHRDSPASASSLTNVHYVDGMN